MPFIKYEPLDPDHKVSGQIRKRCRSREHNPPSHIVLRDGKHTWECPECGETVIIVVAECSWSLGPNSQSDTYLGTWKSQKDISFMSPNYSLQVSNGSSVNVVQQDLRSNKILIDFGNDKLDWYHKSDLTFFEKE